MNKLLSVIKHPEKLIIALDRDYHILGWMNDRKFVETMFKFKIGRSLDLSNPKTFNEKLQWIKLYDHNPIYTTMVDKLKVKQYVAERIGQQYVIPTLGVWDNFDDIDFSILPDQFVLKCTHDSGGLVIVKDKGQLDIKSAKKKINKSLKTNYYKVGREWPYKNVERRIIAEKYMSNSDEDILVDYKVLCFNGVPKLVEVHHGRYTRNHTQDFYDTDWVKTDFEQPEDPRTNIVMEKPVFADEMFELSSVLAEGIPHVRVDWYFVQGQLYFGEMTFFDGSGFCPFLEGQDEILGEWIELPKNITK